jgi:hypothetical protein
MKLALLRRRFGLEVVGHVEPKPGIPPSPAHLEAIDLITREKVKILIWSLT